MPIQPDWSAISSFSILVSIILPFTFITLLFYSDRLISSFLLRTSSCLLEATFFLPLTSSIPLTSFILPIFYFLLLSFINSIILLELFSSFLHLFSLVHVPFTFFLQTFSSLLLISFCLQQSDLEDF